MRRNCRARLRTLPQIQVYQSSSLPPEACRSVDDVGVEFQRLSILGDDGHVGEVVGTPVTALCSSVTGTETMAATSDAMPAVQTSHAFLQKTPPKVVACDTAAPDCALGASWLGPSAASWLVVRRSGNCCPLKRESVATSHEA